MKTRRKLAGLAVIALVLFGCSKDDKPVAAASGSGSGGSSADAKATVTGPSPGVTADTIKVGVTFVDVKALEKSNIHLTLGDHQKVYQALFDDINANGGIDGRKIEPIFAPVDPTNGTSADATCLQLTEDEDVFLVTGFFLTDAVVCPLDTHETAVVGGGMTPDRLARAKAPWVTWLSDTEQPAQVVKLFADKGKLSGKVAVWANARDADLLNGTVLPALTKAGVTPVEVATDDAPADDNAANQAQTRLAVEKFKAANAETILLVGQSAGNDWPEFVPGDYRPKLLFTDLLGPKAFSSNKATTDTTVLNGSFAGGGYGPDEAIFEDATMQKCIAILTKAGITTPAPKDVAADPSNQPYQAAFQACPDVFLMKALLEAAGPNLNYGTLTAAIADGPKVTIPGDPTARTYGPPPAADGNPSAYLYSWDQSKKEFAAAS